MANFHLFFFLHKITDLIVFGEEVIIFYTSNVDGYLKACNCPGNLFGGLIYADEVIKNVKDTNDNVIVIDGGDLFPSKNWIPKANYVIKLYNHIGLDIINIGDQEFQFGFDYLKEKGNEAKFDFVSANIRKNGKLVFKPFLIKKIGSLKIGIIGYADPHVFYSMNMKDIDVIPADKSLPPIIKEIAHKCDFLILLSHSGMEKDKILAKAFPEIDLILGAHSEILSHKPKKINKTYIIHSGSFAHYLLKITLSKSSANKKKITYESIKLEGIPISRSVQKIYESYLQSSDELTIAASEKLKSKPHNYKKAPSADDCGACHFDEYSQWLKTSHAKAWHTIEEDGRTQDISCIACHTTLYQKDKGFVSLELTPELTNVTCVSCHIDYEGHPDQKESFQSVKEELCRVSLKSICNKLKFRKFLVNYFP